MKKYKYIFVQSTVLMTAIAMCGCKEKYLPAIKEVNINYLVVEGLINTGTDSTIFTLSRTFKLNNSTIEAPEKAAIIQVEDETGSIYVLPELLKAGRYGRAPLGLDPIKKYRLRIRTTDKREYLSEFVESKTSPPMEINYDFKNDDLNIYANTKDATGKSKYYRYSYVETWAYEAALNSTLKIVNHQILNRLPEEYTFRCWHIIPSGEIVLGSTENLTQDHLDKRIILLSNASPKLDFEYSVLVRQTVLTREGFNFWETMRNNNERVGGIFDAQPSQLFGNIKSISNPSEIVIGFVSAGTYSEKRLTFKIADMPVSWNVVPQPDTVCTHQSVKFFNVGPEVTKNLIEPDKPSYIPLEPIFGSAPLVPVAYKVSTQAPCVDCRMQGGTTIQPPYMK